MNENKAYLLSAVLLLFFAGTLNYISVTGYDILPPQPPAPEFTIGEEPPAPPEPELELEADAPPPPAPDFNLEETSSKGYSSTKKKITEEVEESAEENNLTETKESIKTEVTKETPKQLTQQDQVTSPIQQLPIQEKNNGSKITLLALLIVLLVVLVVYLKSRSKLNPRNRFSSF